MNLTKKQEIALVVAHLDNNKWLRKKQGLSYTLEDLSVGVSITTETEEKFQDFLDKEASSLNKGYIREKAQQEVGDITLGQVALKMVKNRLWMDPDTIEGLKETIEWEMEFELAKKTLSKSELTEWTVSRVSNLLRCGWPNFRRGFKLEDLRDQKEQLKKLALAVAALDNQWLKENKATTYSLEFLGYPPKASQDFRKSLRQLAKKDSEGVEFLDYESYRKDTLKGKSLGTIALDMVKHRLYTKWANMGQLKEGIDEMKQGKLINYVATDSEAMEKFTVLLVDDLLHNGFQPQAKV